MKTAFIYSIVKRWAFVLAVLLIIVMNFLSNAIPFGGNTMAEISNKYQTLITPAGYAFAIWGLIYLTLAVFAFFQLTKGKEVRFYKLVWPYFLVNAVANVLWLLAFQNEHIGFSVLIMAIILATLIAIFRLFYRLQRSLGTTRRYFFQVPFSMYFGWICVASIVNVAAYLKSISLPALENIEPLLAMVMIIIAAVLGLTVLIAKKDYVFALTVVWALFGIWIGQQDTAIVMNTAKFSAFAVLATCGIQFLADRIKVSNYGGKAISQTR